MQTIKKSHIVPFSNKQMYELVDNINEYHSFIPWCILSKELERDQNTVTATLGLSYQGMQKSFTTKNTLHPHSLIELTLVDGPFSHLEGFWRFDEIDEGCKIDFELNFAIKNKLMAMFIGPIFEKATSGMLDIFCKQAETCYSTHDY